MSLIRFPPSMAASSSASETTPLLGPATTGVKNERDLKIPGPSVFPLFCVIAAVLLERITYYGVLANLIVFLTYLNIPWSHAIVYVFVFTGMAWLMSTFGGFIGDVISGRYNAIWGSLLIYIGGAVVLVTVAYFQNFLEGKYQTFVKVLCLISLFIISIGEGAYKANISAFGAEQVEVHNDNVYRNYFNWYYWSINLGSFIAYSGIAYFQLKENFFSGFLIPLSCIFLATVVFCCGRRYYFINSPTGYFKKVYQIIKEARSRRRQDTNSRYSRLLSSRCHHTLTPTPPPTRFVTHVVRGPREFTWHLHYMATVKILDPLYTRKQTDDIGRYIIFLGALKTIHFQGQTKLLAYSTATTNHGTLLHCSVHVCVLTMFSFASPVQLIQV